jgi:hypothetical protein
MAHPSGHGFITDIMPIAYHFRLPPERHGSGRGPRGGAHAPGEVPGNRKGGTHGPLHKKVIRLLPGTMDREDARDGIVTPNRLVVTIDNELRIKDAITRK